MPGIPNTISHEVVFTISTELTLHEPRRLAERHVTARRAADQPKLAVYFAHRPREFVNIVKVIQTDLLTGAQQQGD